MNWDILLPALFLEYHELTQLLINVRTSPLTLVLCGKNVLILRSIQQRDLCNPHCLSVKWRLPYFCSSYFAFLFPALKNLSELAKGCGAWEQGQEGAGRWVSLMLIDIIVPNSSLNPPGSCCTPSLVSTEPPSQYLVPHAQVLSCSLLDGVLPRRVLLHTPASHTLTFTFRPNGAKPKRIMPQGPHKATNIQLFLRQIFLDL